jgi:hypothetical protein
LADLAGITLLLPRRRIEAAAAVRDVSLQNGGVGNSLPGRAFVVWPGLQEAGLKI